MYNVPDHKVFHRFSIPTARNLNTAIKLVGRVRAKPPFHLTTTLCMGFPKLPSVLTIH